MHYLPLHRLFISLVLMMLSSCAVKGRWIQTKWLISGNPGQTLPEKAVVRTTILNRFDKFGCPNCRLGIQGDTLIVDAKLKFDDSNQRDSFRALFTSNSLDLMPTITRHDSVIHDLDTAILNVDGFMPYFEFLDLSYIADEVLGVACQESTLISIKDSLQKRLNFIKGLQLFWSKDKKYIQHMHTSCFELYMLASPKKTWITDRDIDQAIHYKDDYSTYHGVQLTFTKEGEKKFAQLTEEAAKKDHRAIAIVVYERVIVAPKVMEPIYEGKCNISGIYSFEEAWSLARDINIGRLGFDLTLIQEAQISR